jgi:elongation factor G
MMNISGANCASGDTFVDAKTPKKDIVSMESMYIPDPVISMAIKNKHHKDDDKFSKALARFVVS